MLKRFTGLLPTFTYTWAQINHHDDQDTDHEGGIHPNVCMTSILGPQGPMVTYYLILLFVYGSRFTILFQAARRCASASMFANGIVWQSMRRLTPTLLYHSENGTLTRKERQMLTTTETRCLRKAAGKTRMEKIRNDEIRRRVNMQPAEQTANKNKIRWWSHVMRMAPTAPQSRALVIHPV